MHLSRGAEKGKTYAQLESIMSFLRMEGLVTKAAWCIYSCGCTSAAYLSERPGELHVFGGRVAALQQPGSAVHVHQTLVVVVIDCRAQHPEVKLLGAGVVDVLLGSGKTKD